MRASSTNDGMVAQRDVRGVRRAARRAPPSDKSRASVPVAGEQCSVRWLRLVFVVCCVMGQSLSTAAASALQIEDTPDPFAGAPLSLTAAVTIQASVAGDPQLTAPRAVLADSGNIFILDPPVNGVHRFDRTGEWAGCHRGRGRRSRRIPACSGHGLVFRHALGIRSRGRPNVVFRQAQRGLRSIIAISVRVGSEHHRAAPNVWFVDPQRSAVRERCGGGHGIRFPFFCSSMMGRSATRWRGELPVAKLPPYWSR